MRKGEGKRKNKRSIASILMVTTLITLELVPLFSYAEDIETDNLPVELVEGEVTDDDGLVEVEEETELEIKEPLEDGLEYLDGDRGKEEELELGEHIEEGIKEDDVIGADGEESMKEEHQPQMVNVMSVNNDPVYVKATDKDFEFVEANLPGTYRIEGNLNQGYYRYTGKEEYVEIPHTIKGTPMKNYYRMFYDAPKELKGVKSTNTNITEMRHMFENANSPTLDVSQINTSNVINMTGMFYNSKTSNLIGLDKMDTQKVRQMEIMFEGSSMKSIDVSNFKTPLLRGVTGMFRGAKATEIKGIENLDTSSVTSMYGMFEGTNVTDINVSKWDTENVNNMSNMYKDSSFNSLDLRGFNTVNVTNMAGMFQDADATTIYTSGFNTEKVTNMSSMFEGTKVRTEIQLESFNTSNLTNMDRMFYHTQAEVLNASGFDTSNVVSMDEVFTGSLATTIGVTGWDTRNVETMRDMFRDTNAKVLDLSSFNTSRIVDMSNLFRGAKAETILIGNFDTTYVINMENMFMDTRATEIDLSSFDMSGVNNTGNMFLGSTTTSGISRSKEDAEKLNKTEGKPTGLTFRPKYVMATDDGFIGTINGSFQYRGKENYIEIPHTIRGVNVTSYKDMFANTTVKGVISTNDKVVDMSGMFRGNTSEELDVSTINTDSVVYMYEMFKDTKATYLDLRNFDTSNVRNMGGMFRDTSASHLDLGSFDISNVNETNRMFSGTKATTGYARTQEDLDKINRSPEMPTSLTFKLWGVQVQQTPKEWTNGSVGLQIKAESGDNTIDKIEMLNEKHVGRNLMLNSNFSDPENMEFWRDEGNIVDDAKFGKAYLTGDNYTRTDYIDFGVEEGDIVTVSFYAKKESATYIDVAIEGNQVAYGQRVNLGNEWQYYSLTFTLNGVGNNALRFYGDGTKYLANIKYELGREATEWTPAPEDLGLDNTSNDTFTVNNNGSYVFRVTDSTGDTRTVSHLVSNIDKDKPTIEVERSTSGLTSQDVILYVNAKDTSSGIDSITLPDNKKVNGGTAEYVAKTNKNYTFKVADKAGNEESITVTVDNIDRTIPLIKTTLNTTAWTRNPVNITVESADNARGLSYIVMDNIPDEGRNLIIRKDEIDGRYLNLSGNLAIQVLHSTMREYIKVTPGETLHFSQTDSKTVTDGGYFRWNWYDENEEFVGRMPNISNEFSWKVPNNVHYIWVSYPKDASPKIERGSKATPWSPAPEDEEFTGNSRVFTVSKNGNYEFKASYLDGTTSEVSVNVTNIDLESPELTVINNPTDWTQEDEIKLELVGYDKGSGVKGITLPNGEYINSNKGEYSITTNGNYEFIVEDNVGNKATYTVTVDKMMIPYFFYIYDHNNQPLTGAGFELLRDGVAHARTESDDNGLVDFGKVPPTGKYTIKQIKAPDGYIVDPEEKDVDVEDDTDPIEIINYPRGTEMPSTGTMGTLVIVTTVVVISLGLYLTNKRKRNTNK